MESAKASQPGRAGHPKAVAALLVVATLIAFVAIFSIWANRQALNTDNWVNTSDRLLRNEEVRAQLSGYLADQLFENVDVQTELESTLPPPLHPLAGPAAGALHQLAPKVAERALENPKFLELWDAANRSAHSALLKILDDEGEAISTGGGEVKLDLGVLLTKISSQLGVGGGLAAKLPADAGEITILKSEELSTAQTIARLIRKLPIVLTLLALILYGLAVFLAGPRRRQALRSVGFGFIVAGLLALLARGFAGGVVVDALATNESVRPAAEAVWGIGTSLLVTVASSSICFGILVVLGAWLAGPTGTATALRREAAPYVNEERAAAYGAAVIVFLILIAWAPVAAFHKAIGILLFAVLLGAGTEILRRQILREFPDAERSEVWSRLRERRHLGAAAPAPAAAPSGVDELERLSALRKSGDLTEDEYGAAKARLLAAPKPDDG